MEADSNGNIFIGKELMVEDTRDSLIYASGGHQLIVTIGVENLVVVDTGDVLMVCSKDQAQDVRQIVEKLRETTSPYL
jgi:mannose-1-phosphate guanylyltransferase